MISSSDRNSILCILLFCRRLEENISPLNSVSLVLTTQPVGVTFVFVLTVFLDRHSAPPPSWLSKNLNFIPQTRKALHYAFEGLGFRHFSWEN